MRINDLFPIVAASAIEDKKAINKTIRGILKVRHDLSMHNNVLDLWYNADDIIELLGDEVEDQLDSLFKLDTVNDYLEANGVFMSASDASPSVEEEETSTDSDSEPEVEYIYVQPASSWLLVYVALINTATLATTAYLIYKDLLNCIV